MLSSSLVPQHDEENKKRCDTHSIDVREVLVFSTIVDEIFHITIFICIFKLMNVI